MTIEFNEPKEIELLNDLIFQAGEHGSDGQGWYYVNKEGLEESINDFLKFYKLDEKYEAFFKDKIFVGIAEKNFINDFLNRLKNFDKDTTVYLPTVEYTILYNKAIEEEKCKPKEERILTKIWGEYCLEYKGIKIREKK